MSNSTEMQDVRRYMITGFDYDESYGEYVPYTSWSRFGRGEVHFTSAAPEYEVDEEAFRNPRNRAEEDVGLFVFDEKEGYWKNVSIWPAVVYEDYYDEEY